MGLVDVVLAVGLGAGGPRRRGGDGEQEERGGGAAAGGGRGWEVWSPARRRRWGWGWAEEEAEQRLERHVASRGEALVRSKRARYLMRGAGSEAYAGNVCLRLPNRKAGMTHVNGSNVHLFCNLFD